MPSQPPGRSSRAAVTSSPRTTSRPSGPPHSASGGSWSATSRGTPGAVGHVGRVGDHEVDRAVELAEQPRIGHVAGQHLDRGVPRGRPGGGVVPGPLDRARVALDGDDAGAGELVRDRQREGAGAGCRGRRRRGAVEPGQPLERPAGQQLGLRPRHEDAGADGELQVAEGRPPGEVLQRHAVGALVEQRGEPGGVVVRRRRPAVSRAGRGTPRGRGRAAARRPPGATRRRRRRGGGRRRRAASRTLRSRPPAARRCARRSGRR